MELLKYYRPEILDDDEAMKYAGRVAYARKNSFLDTDDLTSLEMRVGYADKFREAAKPYLVDEWWLMKPEEQAARIREYWREHRIAPRQAPHEQAGEAQNVPEGGDSGNVLRRVRS